VANDGTSLRVLFPGLRGRGRGPDFRHALIATPRVMLHGDVEASLRASDFRRHGHHRDPAYDGVVLHVVAWDDEGQGTLLRCGRSVPVLAMDTGRRWAEGWALPCHSAVKRLGAEEVTRALERLGDVRLVGKMARWLLEVRAHGPEEALYRALAEAMGYAHNRGPFLALAERLPWRELRPALLAAPSHLRASTALGQLVGAAMAPPPLPWREEGVRPANRPQARLGALAHLLARWAEKGLAQGLLGALEEGMAPLLRALQGPGLGRHRALEVALNAVIPIALAMGLQGERTLAVAARTVYAHLPRPGAYAPVRHLEEALAGHLPLRARHQQGLLYLYTRYCTHGGCGRCPLS